MSRYTLKVVDQLRDRAQVEAELAALCASGASAAERIHKALELRPFLEADTKQRMRDGAKNRTGAAARRRAEEEARSVFVCRWMQTNYPPLLDVFCGVAQAIASGRAREGQTHLYVLGIERDASVAKVGVADMVLPRVEQIQTGCPYRLDVRASWPLPHAIAWTVERAIHERLCKRGAQLSGGSEWFGVDCDELVASINSGLEVRSQFEEQCKTSQ